MIVAMAPRNVLVGRRPRKDAAAAPGAGPGDCGFRVAPEGPVLMDEATDVSHASPQGRRPLDLRFRESDLAQQLVKARVAPCGQGSPGARGGGGGQGRSRGGGEKYPPGTGFLLKPPRSTASITPALSSSLL
jgi:hypothetical protein